MVLSFDLFLWVGGYWSREGSYVGGESHEVGKTASEGFSLRSIQNVLVEGIGLEDNQHKVSWFPPENPGEREDIDDDEVLEKSVFYSVRTGALTLFIVREDDPYLIMRGGDMLGDVSSEDDIQENVSSGDGGDDEEENENGGGVNDEIEYSEEEGEIQHDEIRSESEDFRESRDKERKYKSFEIGQSYTTIQTFKDAILKYAVKKKFDISFFKSDSKRVTAVCCDRKCPWMIYASINSTTPRVVIRTLQAEHDCTWQGKVSLLTNARIADLYMEEFRLNPDFSANQLQQKLLKRNINVPWTICERTRLRCLQTFDAEQAESFARLFDYVHEIKRSNHGTTAECEIRQGVFYRFYVCFGALKDGWKAACRKIIHIDGTFLKWRMTGQLLVACGRDPNDQMFPIAWGIVDGETKEHWIWFFEHLVEDLGLESGNGLTLMSDQCKGLIAAVNLVLPFAEHRLCARHVYHNWKKTYSGAEFEDLFWGAADAYYMAAFDRKMEALKQISQAAYDQLKLSPSCAWSRAYYSDISTCDAVENNLGESFNAAIRVARTKPVVEMLEEIRRRVLVGNEKKRKAAENAKGIYTPRARVLLDQQINLAKNCSPLPCGLGKYEVGYFNDRFVVNLRGEVKCACRMYKTSGIPCSHIVSALRLERDADQNPNTLLSDWFTVEKLKRCYENPMEPVNGMNLWTKTTDVRVMPPPYKKPPGRPPGKKRKRDKGEGREKGKMSKVGMTMHCSNCGQEGHNKSNCKNAHVHKFEKPPGRPRKNALSAATSQLTLALQASEASQASQASRVSRASTSISKAPPKTKPGRPRRSWFDTSTSSQKAPPQPPQVPIYDIGPIQLPKEGYGIFTSPLTGDDYISVGSRVVDTRDNTVLSNDLYRARERKKMAVSRGRGKGRGK